MSDDEILETEVLYTPEEILAEFQESCEAEAEEPGQFTERLNRAAEDLCQMLERQKGDI